MPITKHGIILIVEDERSIRSLLRTYLESEGYTVREAGDGVAALETLSHEIPDVLLLDLSIPPPQGMEILRRIREASWKRKPAVIVLTAHGSIKLAVEAMKLGAMEFLEKPVTPESLLATIDRVINEHALAHDQSLDSYDALLARARIALSDGDPEQAERLLLRAAPLGDKDPAYWNLMGLLAEIRGDYAQARKHYGHAIGRNSHYAPAQQNMRRLYELWEFGRSNEEASM